MRIAPNGSSPARSGCRTSNVRSRVDRASCSIAPRSTSGRDPPARAAAALRARGSCARRRRPSGRRSPLDDVGAVADARLEDRADAAVLAAARRTDPSPGGGTTSRARWKIASRQQLAARLPSPRGCSARERRQVIGAQHRHDHHDQRRHAGDLFGFDRHHQSQRSFETLRRAPGLLKLLIARSRRLPPSFIRFSLLCSVFRLMPRISAARVLLLPRVLERQHDQLALGLVDGRAGRDASASAAFPRPWATSVGGRCVAR